MKRASLRPSARSPWRVLAAATALTAALILLLWLGLNGPSSSSASASARTAASGLLSSPSGGADISPEDIREAIAILKSNGMFFGKSPPAMPSTQLEGLSPEEAKETFKRGPFGGRGDPVHLGGFVTTDPHGLAPALWEYMIKVINVKSMVDIGCGRGKNTKYFLDKGVDVLCVEGSHDAVSRTFLPADRVVEHDFSRGPWWPEKTFDMAFSIEFLEHVQRQFMDNYIPIMKKSAIVVATHAMQIGYHHVEVHTEDWWWRSRFAARGFIFSPELTELFREICRTTNQGTWYRQSVEVYINPLVASRPEHAHLFGGGGCLAELPGQPTGPDAKIKYVTAPCTGAQTLPQSYQPVWNGEAEGPWKEKERLEAKSMTPGWVKASAFAGHGG